MTPRKDTTLVRTINELFKQFNDQQSSGISLKNGIGGEILELQFAPNESLIVNHGLGKIPSYRLILRQTGNAVITDVNSAWTNKTVGFLNNSANTVTLTIKLMVE